jgi:hypothetical protein
MSVCPQADTVHNSDAVKKTLLITRILSQDYFIGYYDGAKIRKKTEKTKD